MKARRRIAIVALCVLLFVLAVAVVVLLRKQAPPEAARLLPEADAVIYIDFATVRNLTSLDQQPLPNLAPGYRDFVQQTGFAFERDLDEAAMAVHHGRLRDGRRTPTRYSEVLVGHYDQTKMARYLHQRARSVESYRNTEIFAIPIEDRTLRVALLALDTVAISNVDDAAVIHGIIDRFRKAALPFGGPKLVRRYYREVPLGSLLWAMARLEPESEDSSRAPSFTLPGGLEVSLPPQSDVVVSLRLLTSVEARADFHTPSEEAAHSFTEQIGTLLALFHSVQEGATRGGGDPDVKAALDSLEIAQKGSRAELTATIPPGFLRKLVAQPAEETLESAPAQGSEKR